MKVRRYRKYDWDDACCISGSLDAGIPVCFSLAIPTLIYFLMNTGSVPVEFIAHQTTNPLTNYVLIALPAFLLSGRMMNGTGVTHRIFDLANALVGRFRGGLVYTNIVASMWFASMIGNCSW